MRRPLFLIVATGALLAADAPKKDDPAKKELDKFQGTWIVVSVEDRFGKRNAEDTKQVVKLTIKGNKFTMNDGEGTLTGTFKLDPTKKPKTVDVTITEGFGQGNKLKGIYEMDGDKRKACHNTANGGDRPTKFTAEGTYMIIEYKREKPVK
jgi:uncharacterized protein (TIGR03067 family)